LCGRCRLGSTSPISGSVPEIPKGFAPATPGGPVPARRDYWRLATGYCLRACPVWNLLFFPFGPCLLFGACYLVLEETAALPGLPRWGFRCFFSPVPGSMFHVPGSAVFFSRPAPLGFAVSSPGPGFHVPCSMFPVPPFSFPGLPRWGYYEIYFCTITTVLTITNCWGEGGGW